MVYDRSSNNCALRQCEILANLIEVRLDPSTISAPPNEKVIDEIVHPWAIVMSQDCDLDQDYQSHQSGEAAQDKKLPSILFCQVTTAEALRGREDMNGGLWKRISRNQDDRYHFLERVPPEQDALNEGLPELAIDFKRFFTIPREEVYIRIQTQAKRRCRLISPYLEHLARRFHNYLGRVALPEPLTSE